VREGVINANCEGGGIVKGCVEAEYSFDRHLPDTDIPFVNALPKWLKIRAEEHRQMRLVQPRVSSEEAQRQFNRVMRIPEGAVQNTSRSSNGRVLAVDCSNRRS
jgi:hypothetical protein